MQVVNLAVDDVVFQAAAYPSALSDATLSIAANLSQVVAAGSLCNSAVFGPSDSNNVADTKAITGDATGRSTMPSRHA